MNKKAVIGDFLTLYQSGLVLGLIAILFGTFFFYLQISANESYSTNIISENTELYDFANFFLNLKFRIESKEATINQLIQTYCHNKDKETLEYLERAAISLSPEPFAVKIFCGTQKLDDCSKIDKNNAELATATKSDFAVSSLLLKLPALNTDLINCIEISKGQNQVIFFSDLEYVETLSKNRIPRPINNTKIAVTKKSFEAIVNSKLNTVTKDSWFIMLSPSKDLWFRNEKNLWCSPINDGCSDLFGKKELLQCKGDYLICKDLK